MASNELEKNIFEHQGLDKEIDSSPIFISHDHNDSAMYSTLSLALKSKDIECWDVSEMSAGKSLPEQLREAIKKCGLCVFIATSRSVKSKWCNAELGAFWGFGKTVIVFLADPEIEEENLPPQFKDNLMTADADKLIEAIERTKCVSESDGNFKFFSNPDRFEENSNWLKILDEADKRFDLLGVTLDSYRSGNEFEKKILEKAKTGCKIRILYMSDAHKALPNIYIATERLKTVQEKIKKSTKYFLELMKEDNIECRKISKGIPYFFLNRNESHAVIVQYLASQKWGAGPIWRCPKNSELYSIAGQEFEKLWELATSIEKNVKK